ncbi:S53 family peptidase [Amycolatopsis anabasis]|uniref:S53 family peptidase n=1 Tax=Amycolatopsis anabasis TaxID=1840409 RepID=UPI001FE880BD|nr:S53 family serine peptidase [Amycolatopsis anabasis]
MGDADGHTVRHIQVALALRDPAGAQVLAKAVSTPGDARYRQHLSPGEFVGRFAADDGTVNQVRSWLASQGVQVTGMSANRHFLDAQADINTLERAFGTGLSLFRHTIGGAVRTLLAPDTPISLPRELRGAITTVLGLDDSGKTLKPQHIAPATPASPGPLAQEQHCARWWAQSNNTEVPQRYPAGMQSNSLCGYNGTSMRAMYGLTGANTGTGAHVGIVGAYRSPTVVSDTNRAAQQLGVPQLNAGQYKEVLPDRFDEGPDCDPESWRGEHTLDVQAVHTMSTAAEITYYAGKNCGEGLDAAFNAAVEANAVDVITNSWGGAGEDSVPPATLDQFNSMALQAAIQGQTVLVSSGDAGNNSGILGRPGPQFPASSPWVTAVGGTTVGLDQGNNPRVLTGWENAGNTLVDGQWRPQQDKDGPFAGGAGGGRSDLYVEPDYQRGVVPDQVAGGKRAVPDVSALADSYTGMLVGYTDPRHGFYLGSYGGTSLASPLLAGLVADAQHAQHVERFGFLNPALYGMRGTPAVTDVVPQRAGVWTPAMHALPGAVVPGAPGSYLVDFDTRPQNLQSGPGWDPVTGIGTPRAGFVTALGK